MHKMIGVAKNRGEVHQFGSPQLEDPTAQLFQYLETKRSRLTLGELYDVLSSDSVKRPRTAKRLIDPNGMCYVPYFVTRIKTEGLTDTRFHF